MSKLIEKTRIYIYIYIQGIWKGCCLLTNKTISLMEGGY